MRFYLAARYGRRFELLECAKQIEARGGVVTSRWLSGAREAADLVSSPEQAARFAVEDIADIDRADVVLSFTEPPGPVPDRGRGGRHVEFGIALALGCRCVIVGPCEHVFHYLGAAASLLPSVEQYATWAEALDVLLPLQHGGCACQLKPPK